MAKLMRRKRDLVAPQLSPGAIAHAAVVVAMHMLDQLIHVRSVILYMEARQRRIQLREAAMKFLALSSSMASVAAILLWLAGDRGSLPAWLPAPLLISCALAWVRFPGPTAKMFDTPLCSFRELDTQLRAPGFVSLLSDVAEELRAATAHEFWRTSYEARLLVAEDMWSSIEPARDAQLLEKCQRAASEAVKRELDLGVLRRQPAEPPRDG